MTAPTPRRRTKKQAQAARRAAAGAPSRASTRTSEGGQPKPEATVGLTAEQKPVAQAEVKPAPKPGAPADGRADTKAKARRQPGPDAGPASGAPSSGLPPTLPPPPLPPSFVTSPQPASVRRALQAERHEERHQGAEAEPAAARSTAEEPTPSTGPPSLSSLAPAPGAPGRHGAVGHAPLAATRSVDSTATPHVNGQVNGKPHGRSAAEPGSPPEPAPAPAPAPPPAAEAFDALHQDAGMRLVQQTYLLTGSQHRAAHCVRRAFQMAWTNWSTVGLDRSPEGWVRAAAFELALSPWHTGGPRVQHLLRLPHRSPNPAPANPGDTDKALLKAVMRLPRPQRRALVLHDVMGLDWAQTAAEVEGSTPVTFGRVVRARHALARALPGVVGADPQQRGFGRRLGAQLRGVAERGCTEKQPLTAPRITRARARLHDHGLTLASGALTLVTAGGLAAALLWGTPMHPADRPVVVHRTPHATQLAVYSPAQAQPKHLPHQKLPSIPVDWAERARYKAALAKQKLRQKHQAAAASGATGAAAARAGATGPGPTGAGATGAGAAGAGATGAAGGASTAGATGAAQAAGATGGASSGTSAGQGGDWALCKVFAIPCSRPRHTGHGGGGHQRTQSGKRPHH